MESSDIQLLASQNMKIADRDQMPGPTLEHRLFIEFHEKSRIPMTMISLGELCEVIKSVVGANLDEKCKRVIFQNNVDIDGVSVNEFESQIPFALEFENGTYKSGSKSNPIPISSLIVRQNSVSVIVNGDSGDAQEVILGVYNALQTSAGYATKFTEECVHARAHTCLTVARLNFGISSIFSKAILSALNSTLMSDAERFKNVGSMRIDTNQDQLKGYMIVPKIRAVEFDITRFDAASGNSERCILRIAPRTTSDVNDGDYVFTSEYPEDVHNELVAAFISALPG